MAIADHSGHVQVVGAPGDRPKLNRLHESPSIWRCVCLLALILVALIQTPSVALAARHRIGAFYFPGWTESDWTPKGVWTPIKAYPEREPLLGWYREGDPLIMERQLDWMSSHGIDFVMFDWYYSHDDVRAEHALKAYLTVPQDKVSFALMWANHDEPTTPAIWRRLVATWIDRYFASSRYERIKGRPVVMILSLERLAANAKTAGTSLKQLIDTARAMTNAASMPEIYFVGGTDDMSIPLVRTDAPAAGIAAISAYNLHRKTVADAVADPNWGRLTRGGYRGLDAAYRAQWAQGLKLPLPFIVPMTSGWDHRPWGPSPDPLHDRAIATSAEFRAHLSAARRILDRPGRQRSGIGLICCWNEFGEGSFIEPTKREGLDKLDQIHSVFGIRRVPKP